MNPASVLKNLRPRLAVVTITALAAVACWAVLADTAGAASSGGIGSTDTSTTSTTTTSTSGEASRTEPTYKRLWDRFTLRDRRWARQTAECESGGDPRAVGGGGLYRGAFQFMKSTWRDSPKSPGGDPIIYTYRTQAVVAVLLMHRVGTHPWPVCG